MVDWYGIGGASLENFKKKEGEKEGEVERGKGREGENG